MVKWNEPLLAIAFSIYGIMHTMTFNGQQIALRHFGNSYEKVVYADNAHMMGISIYYHGISIGYGELMHFNGLCLFLWLTGVYVSKTTYFRVSRLNVSRILDSS